MAIMISEVVSGNHQIGVGFYQPWDTNHTWLLSSG